MISVPKMNLSSPLKADFLLSFINIVYFANISSNSILLRVMPSLFHLLMFAIYLDFLALKFLGKEEEQWKITISYVLTMSLSIGTCLIMYRKRKELKLVLKNFRDLSQPIKNNMHSNAVLVVIFCTSLLYPVLIVVESEILDKRLKMYTYNKIILNKTLRSVVYYLKIAFITMLYPAFTNVVTLLVCKLCHQCSAELQSITASIMKCPSVKFTHSEQIEILRSKARIVEILEGIQGVFSLPSLFLGISQFSACFSLVRSLVLYDVKNFSFLEVIDNAFSGIYSTVPLIATIWIAGRIPIEIAKFKNAYYKKTEQRMFLGLSSEDARLEKWSYGMPDFVLTAGDFLQFKRNMILTFTGTLLTYTFLIITTNRSNVMSPIATSTNTTNCNSGACL